MKLGHKSQGLGLEAILVHLDEKSAVNPGWLFVALTRLLIHAASENLQLGLINPPPFEVLQCSTYVCIVYICMER